MIEQTNTNRLPETIADIRENVPRKDAYVILAEEAAELAQASVKMYRQDSKTIPTPLPYHDAVSNIIEELTDVLLSAYVAGVMPDESLMQDKANRWLSRIEEARGA